MRKLTLTIVGDDDDVVLDALALLADGMPSPAAQGEDEGADGELVTWQWEEV